MTNSDDDVEVTGVVKPQASKKRKHPTETSLANHGADDDTTASEDDAPSPAKRQRSSAPPPLDAVKVEWSDGDEDAYQTFKHRKAAQRKQAAAATRKARGRTAGKKKTTRRADGTRPAAGTAAGTAAVTTADPSKKTSAPDAPSEDDAPIEDPLPDYLQKRRKGFEVSYAQMKEAGLKLPPDYDDIEFSDDERLEALERRPAFPAGTPCAPAKDITLPYSLGVVPAPLVQWLRSYQLQGVAFLHELFVYQKGGILGDDMGLGKTVQVIAFLTAALGKTGDERDGKRMRKMRRADDGRWYPRVLVVCPGSLIENWKDEFRRWGWWQIDVYHGEGKAAALEAAASGRLEIMITTYATYRLNKDRVNVIDWDCVIADECHLIKERKSEITQAMNDVNALCRIGLTGTAIQNRYEELWTLLNWTNPGRFGPLSTWIASISQPLRQGQSHDATIYQLSRARKTARKLVQNLLPAFFLRRMKTLIADQLPKKRDTVVFCPLTDTQRQAYERFLASDAVQAIKRASERCDCGSSKRRGYCCHQRLASGERWQAHIFPAIMTLQRLSNHLALLIPQPGDGGAKQGKDLATLQLVLPAQWPALYQTRGSIANYADPSLYGKWSVLKRLLRFWHEHGDKVLVFSHSVRLLRMLRMLFHHTSYNVSYLDGAMSYDDRARTVHDFNADPAQFVFLISTRAGGVGLNITAANKVVVVDPNWNPSYDLQAQDRAYRIGQVRDVEVFRLVSAGTIEEIVYARQIYKQQQANIGYRASTERRYFRGVQQNTEQKGELFGLANLLAFERENVVLRDIINKTNVAESKAGVDVVRLAVDEPAAGEAEAEAEEADEMVAAVGVSVKSEAVDDNDDDDVLSKSRLSQQLVALVGEESLGVRKPTTTTTKKKAAPPATANRKTDAIQAILAQAGVEYVHENAHVVGSSRIEAQLSKRAEEAGTGLDTAVAVFANEDDSPTPSNPFHHYAYRYHPPVAVQTRQFCEMSRAERFRDPTRFALVVEAWTPAQRRAYLERFYARRREGLAKAAAAAAAAGGTVAVAAAGEGGEEGKGLVKREEGEEEEVEKENEEEEGDTT
ncbi:MAG: hypothetical protein M1826_000205 [Phylliscum demangeonii]|nr:MAG: hypothetical protein M1826_000205 [Phylliscum demangeonii]